ncbi:MAG TPA: glycosyltransferase family 1 protein [Candidatus Saccharimonadales bacterium]|nr:glycosyltransferase family 1 protein [Candidatus Saccharimonadales bacterium]
MKTLIVDGQMWQTNAYFRGMGGYAFGLLSAVVAANEDIELHIVLNERMNHDESRINGIKSWLPAAKIHIVALPHEPKPDSGEEERAAAALDALISGLGRKYEEIYYFIPALFLFQYCAVFPSNVRKVLLFHDLMPLIYRKELGKYFPPHIYFPRFRTIFEADLIVTNSQTTATDLLAYMGLDETRVVNIDGSLNERLVHDDSIKQDARDVLDRLGLRNIPYIMMPTGGLENKNNVRAVEAFRLLCDAGDTKTQLVVTSFFSDLAKRELQLIAGDRITFTGNIDNEDLLILYTHSTALLMPSLYEGLGLPVLEGVAHDKPVACSDVPVFQEIPRFNDALYVFDPFDVEDIARALGDALKKREFAARQKNYPEILRKYSWRRSADIFVEAIGNEAHFTRKDQPITKKYAVLCPDPRKNKDVADFAQRMFAYAQRAGVDIVYFIDPGGDDEVGSLIFPDYIRSLALCYDIDRVYAKMRETDFDEILLFPRNDSRFIKLHRAVLSIPGYVYVSDTGYESILKELAEKKMISDSQMSAERLVIRKAHENEAFDGVSMVARAKGLIVERPMMSLVNRALQAFNLKVPVLEVDDSHKVKEGKNVHKKQQQAFGELLTFIGGKK